MDFISTALVTLKEPTGFWQSILGAFKSWTGTYIVAVILVAILVRVVFSFVDIINKKVNMKNADINNKMKPELEAVQKRYGNDQRVLQQKQSEIYKKYQFSMMSSCLPMLIVLILQSVVFLTLWSGLQSVSNYNIAEKYENMKNVYVNVITLNEQDSLKDAITGLETADYDLSLEIKEELDSSTDTNQTKLVVTLTPKDEEGNLITSEQQGFSYNFKNEWTNEEIYNLLENYVLPADDAEGDEVSANYIDTGINAKIQELAEKAAKENYVENQEGFLWIKNIYKSETTTSPLFTKSEITNYLSKFYTEEEKTIESENHYEEKIFDCVVAGIDSKELGYNGYYILTILAVLTCFLSIWLSQKLMKNKNQTQNGQSAGGSKAMYFIMPIIFGYFTLSYTSLFAIYLIIGQVVNIAITPLTTLIVRKWVSADSKRKQEKEAVVVDYRRKDK